MAILHVTAKTISRGKGQSAVAAAAYRSGTRLRCARTGLVADYRRRYGVRVTRVMVPGGGERDREDLWNAAEAAERRCNSTLAREFELALPAELTPDEQEQIVVAFADALIAKYSVAVDWAIHEPSREGDQRNVHAHVMVTTRTVDEEGNFGEKVRVLDAKGTGPAEIIWIRELVASLCNDALALAGCKARVDPRSHADRGLTEMPGSKLGVASTAIERRTGAPSERRLRQASERAELEEAIAAAAACNGTPQNADRIAEIVGERVPDRDGQSQAGAPSRDAKLEKLGAAGFAWHDVGEVGLFAPAPYASQLSDQRAPSNPRVEQTAVSDMRSGEANKRSRGAIRRARRSAIVLKPTILPYADQSYANLVSGETSSMARGDDHRPARTGDRDLDDEGVKAERPATGSSAEGVTIEQEQVLEREVLLSLRSRFLAEAKMLRVRGPAPPADANSSENALDEPANKVATSASARVSASDDTVSTNAERSSPRQMTVGVQARHLLDRDVTLVARTAATAMVKNFPDPGALWREGEQAPLSQVTEDDRKLPPRIEQSDVTSDDNREVSPGQRFGGLKHSGYRALSRDLRTLHSSPKPAGPNQQSLKGGSSGRRRRRNSYTWPPTDMPRNSSAAVDEPMRRALLGVTKLSTAPDGGAEVTREAPKGAVVEGATAKVVVPWEDLYAACVELGALLLRAFQSHHHEPALLAILEAAQNVIATGSRGLSTSTALLATRLRKDIVAHTGALASVSLEQILKRVSSLVAETNTPELQRLLKVGRDRVDGSSLGLNTRRDRTSSGDLDKSKTDDLGRGQT